MNVFDAMKERRSVKHYDPAHVMPKEDENKLFEHAILSPTSFNIQQWRLVVVRDKALCEKIKEAAWGQAQVADASLLIIMTADLKAWAKGGARYWQNAPQEVQDILVPMIEPFYKGKDRLQRDEAMRSVGIMAQTIMLSAKAMGYDSCPMIGFEPDTVAELINLPDDHVIGMMITVGKALKPASPRGGQIDISEVLVEDRF
jgi:nitroreductase